MAEKNEHSTQAQDDALVESLREAYQPAPLQPMRRARIRARVRARVSDETAERLGARRSGWGLVPAAAALAGVLIVIVGVLSTRRTPSPTLDALTSEEVSAAALLVGDVPLLMGGDFDGNDADTTALPPDYQMLSQLLGERA